VADDRHRQHDDEVDDATVSGVKIAPPVVAGVALTNTSCTFCWWCDAQRASSCAGCDGAEAASCTNLQFPTVLHPVGDRALLLLGSAGNNTGIGAAGAAGPPNPVPLGWSVGEIARPFVSTDRGAHWRPAATPHRLDENFRGLAWQTHIIALAECPAGQRTLTSSSSGCFRAITGDARVCPAGAAQEASGTTAWGTQTVCIAAVDFSLSQTGALVLLATRTVTVSGLPWHVPYRRCDYLGKQCSPGSSGGAK
jgi:hypothetical protein